jgi:HD superfamily phosphohydrolase
MMEQGIDPSFYLEVDFPSDLSYDVYRPGEHDEKLPILLLDNRDVLTEISHKSEIVRSISGIQMGKFHLYFPAELLGEHAHAVPPEARRMLGMETH